MLRIPPISSLTISALITYVYSGDLTESISHFGVASFDRYLFMLLQEGPPLSSNYKGCHLPCIGFTFTKDFIFNDIGGSEDSLNRLKNLIESFGGPPVQNGNHNDANTDALMEELCQVKMAYAQLEVRYLSDWPCSRHIVYWNSRLINICLFTNWSINI